jgi:hypothetical protein
MMLKGVKNLEFYKELTKPARKAMTMPVLKILSDAIHKQNWPRDSKQIFWTALTVAFFGSFRFGELLSQKSDAFNSNETLLWKDVILKDKEAVLHIKVPKSKNEKGEIVNLFEIENSAYCPVKALKRLKTISKFSSDPNLPVFMFENGKMLCNTVLNRTLVSLLEPVLGESAKFFSGHSFRAAVPSALSNCPDLVNDEEIMSWGRWSSNSYKLYMRLNSMQKKHIYSKLLLALEQQ